MKKDFLSELFSVLLLLFIFLPFALVISLWAWLVEPDYDKLAEESYNERE